MRQLTSISLVVCTLLLVAISAAQQPAGTAVPNLIRYGGTLKEAQGTAALPSTTVGVTFAIYKQQDGGAPVWMETQNVTTDAAGNYSVLLGSTTATGLPSDLFSQQEQRWLGVQVQGQAEQPRVMLVSVPYALKAQEAETLAGRSISDFVLANGGTSSADGSAGQAASSGANSSAPSPASATPLTQGPMRVGGSTTDEIVRVIQSGTGAGVNAFASNNAVVGNATAASGLTYGVQGIAASNIGYGVFGNASSLTGQTVGVLGRAKSTSGKGVRGIEIATTGDTVGVSAYDASPAGTAGVFNNAAGGRILRGQNNGIDKFIVDGSGNVNAAGTFTGSGAGLTGLQFSQLSGLLGSAQFSGSYTSAVTLSNTSNVFYGDGSHLTGTGGGGGCVSSPSNSQPPNANRNIAGTGTVNGSARSMIYLRDSVRFQEVRDMGDSTSALMKLRPVTFFYKPEYEQGTRTMQYGLMADEVAKVYPGMVAYDNDGQPYTVRYQYLAPMLLNEVQKQYQRAEAEAKVITAQQGQIDSLHRQVEDLQQRFSRLETLVGAQGKIAAGAPARTGTQ